MTKKLSKMEKTVKLVAQLDAKGTKAAVIKARIQKAMKFNTLAAASTYLYAARHKIRLAQIRAESGEQAATPEVRSDASVDSVVTPKKRIRKPAAKKARAETNPIAVMVEELLAA